MNRRRRGFTLVEMLVVLAVLSSVLGSIGLIMHMLMRANRNLQDAITVRQQTEQFAWQLRQDTHAASRAALEEAASRDKTKRTIQLEYDDFHNVIYRIENERIDRIEQRSGKMVRQESYHIAPREDLGWQLDSGHAKPIVSVWLYPMVGFRANRDVHPDPIRIVAVVGLSRTAPTRKKKAK